MSPAGHCLSSHHVIVDYHIKARTNWHTLSYQHTHMHFLQRNLYFYWIFTRIRSQSPIDKAALGQAWGLTDNGTLPEAYYGPAHPHLYALPDLFKLILVILWLRHLLIWNCPQMNVTGPQACWKWLSEGGLFSTTFRRNFINPTYIYIRAYWTIYMVSLHYSVHKSIIKLKKMYSNGLKFICWKPWFKKFSGRYTRLWAD